MTKCYWTHDNGGRSFKVCISRSLKDTKDVKVYNNRKELVAQFDDVLKVFIGKSYLCPMTEFSAGHGPSFDGNSILVQLQAPKLSYVVIGWKIEKFKSLAPIVEYASPVGNNDVPYPWARDEKGNFYLMIENVILPSIDIENDDEPYNLYYKLNKISHFKKIGMKTLVDRPLLTDRLSFLN